MFTDKFIFKVHRNGHVERIKERDKFTVSDVVNGLGVSSSTKIECKPLKNSDIYAFYGDDQCEVLIFGVPEQPGSYRADNVVHGILVNQFKVLSTLQPTLS
jgi:hypothetical protein